MHIHQNESNIETPHVLNHGKRLLLSCHIRIHGDISPHVCNICLSHMHAVKGRTPSWVQAPCCDEVWHERCILRVACQSVDETWKCPQCRVSHSVFDLDNWSAFDITDKMFPDNIYEPEVPIHSMKVRRRSRRKMKHNLRSSLLFEL